MYTIIVMKLKDQVQIELDALPGDVFGIRSAYFTKILRSADYDSEQTVTNIGRAAERLAKGVLEQEGHKAHDKTPFYQLIDSLSHHNLLPGIEDRLRSIQKLRNFASHDSGSTLNDHDVLSALHSFGSAYNMVNMKYHLTPDTASAGTETSPDRINESPLHRRIQIITFVLLLMSATLLIRAVFIGGSFQFFTLLRWTLSVSAAVAIWFQILTIRYPSHSGSTVLSSAASKVTLFLFASILILFNPVLPVRLPRELWRILDAVTALVFIAILGSMIVGRNRIFRF